MKPTGGEREREKEREGKDGLVRALKKHIVSTVYSVVISMPGHTCTELLSVAEDGSKTLPNLSVDQRNTCGRSRECCLQIQ